MPKIFVDGEHGTTGLQIRNRLLLRNDLEILSLPKADRHNRDLRADYLRAADIAILCLPDEAAREAVSLVKGYAARVIDTSTAHRTMLQWVYGFAEMTQGQASRIRNAQYISNPGCYATGAIALLRPLREAGILSKDYPISINAISGYSGGGKQLISRMENASSPNTLCSSHFLYALNLQHKHIPEIMKHAHLEQVPIFIPSVGRFLQGMLVCLPLHLRLLKKNSTFKMLNHVLFEHYHEQPFIEIITHEDTTFPHHVEAEELASTDKIKIYVTSNPEAKIIHLIAALDNLGKGAAGAVLQNLNLMLTA